LSSDAFRRLVEVYAADDDGGAPLRITSRGLWHATPLRVAWEATRRLATRARGERRLTLDAGMGDGRLLAAWLATGAGSGRALGVECDAGLFRVASVRLGRLGLLDSPGVAAILGDYERDSSYAAAGVTLRDVDLVLNYPDGNEARLARLVAERCAPGALLCLISPDSPPELPPLRRLWTEKLSGESGVHWSLSALGTGAV
jgi:hypothetical protein